VPLNNSEVLSHRLTIYAQQGKPMFYFCLNISANTQVNEIDISKQYMYYRSVCYTVQAKWNFTMQPLQQITY